MSNIKAFTKPVRVAAAALVIGAAALPALPAQAGEITSFGFTFNSGDGTSFSIGAGTPERERHSHPRRRVCLSDRQLGGALARQGYRDVRLGHASRQTIAAVATRDHRTYRLTVERCSGRVLSAKRIGGRHDDRRGTPRHDFDRGHAVHHDRGPVFRFYNFR